MLRNLCVISRASIAPARRCTLRTFRTDVYKLSSAKTATNMFTKQKMVEQDFEKSKAYEDSQKTFGERLSDPEIAERLTKVVPRPGIKMNIPEKVQRIGDEILALNVLESIQLSDYMREKMGVPLDVPDPFQALIRGLSNMVPGFGAGGINPAMMQQMMQQMPQQGAAQAEEKKEEKPKEEEEKPAEKTEFNVKIESYDPKNKIQLIKLLRKHDSSLPIAKAKEIIEKVPCIIEERVSKERAEEVAKKFEGLAVVKIE